MSALLLIVALVVSFGIMAYFVRKLRIGGEGTAIDWKMVGVFFGMMILGMLAREAFDSATKKQRFNLGDLIVPLLISPMVFGIAYGSMGNMEINVPSLVLCFQNGFFWSTLWEGIQSGQGGSNSGGATPTPTP